MYGFSALLGAIFNFDFKTYGNNKNKIKSYKYICFNNMIDKFSLDKLFYQNEEYMLILDGVILNKNKIMNLYKGLSWFDVIIKLYQESDTFFDMFRGSFSGVLYDKKRDRYIIFSDHIGAKFIYYTKVQDNLFVSSMISEVYYFLKQNNINYNLSIENSYLLLSYGYMLEDRTLCEQIKKIQPGCYLVYENNTVKEKHYNIIDNTPDNSITEKDAIEIMDNFFRKAIKLEFDKDLECGYNKHLVALSAGLDSRMVSWVSHDMGYSHQLNATFSQTNYWDEIIPQKIASDLKHEWIFKALDNGWWLKDVDFVTNVTGGNVLYYGLAHGLSLLKYINFDSLGMIHSGQLGDVVFSSFFYKGTTIDTKFIFGEGAYSSKYLSKIQDNINLHNYKNEEIANFYYRGFNGANNGLQAYYNYTEVISPFHDIDLIDNMLKIPLKIRNNHLLYKKWIIQKYPDAAKYVWEKIGCRIDRKIGFIEYKGKKIRIESIPKKIIRKITKATPTDYKYHMNPVGYYIKTNKELQAYLDNYFITYLDLVPYKELRNDILNINKNNNYIEKIQAISLLSALKLFYK